MDISEGTIDKYNNAAVNQGMSLENAHAVCTVLKDEDDGLSGQKSNVLIVRLDSSSRSYCI